MQIPVHGEPDEELFDFCVVGAGIVGVATALRLTRERPGARVVILEKEEEAATHQSGRNSGVIHSGIYYEPGSLKATLCREGNAATRRFCHEHGIDLKETGKLIVASRPDDHGRLDELQSRAAQNQISVRRVSSGELRELEPNIRGDAGLLVESAAITDYGRITAKMVELLISTGAVIAFGRDVMRIEETAHHVELADTQGRTWRARHLIVCAGLRADRMARLAGLDPPFRIVPFRGEYHRLADRVDAAVARPIYPVPDPALPFLGIHFTPMVDGGITVGPNAVLSLAREKYRKGSVSARDTASIAAYGGSWRLARRYWRVGATEMRNSWSKRAYLRECRRYCPSLLLSDLLPHEPGIRAQAVARDGSMIHDFIFMESARSVHVGNAPSPAATSALPIARHVVQRLLARNP